MGAPRHRRHRIFRHRPGCNTERSNRNSNRNFHRIRAGKTYLTTARRELGGRARLGLLAGAFFIGIASPRIGAAQVVQPPASEVPIPPKPKKDTTAPKPDSIKPRFSRSTDPGTSDVGPQFSWNREELFASGALNVAELLQRVPGTTYFRSGWMKSQKFVAVNGDFSAVRVFYDGIEIDNLSGRTAPLLDLNTIELWTLEKVSIERLGGEIRIYLRSWQADRTLPNTRVDVSTGNEDTNIYRGFYGKRFSNGAGLQFAGQQFNTTSPRFGGGGDELSVLGRVGIGGRSWSVDAFANRTGTTRVLQPTFGTGMSIPGYEATEGIAYLRVAIGRINAGPWIEALATNHWLNETSKHVLVPAALQSHVIADTVDTARTEQQYVLSAGFRRGPLVISGTERIRRINFQTTQSPAARVQFDFPFAFASASVEHDAFAKLNRADAVARFTPLPFVSVSGAISRTGAFGDAPPGTPSILSARIEGGVRVRGPWLLAGFLTRDTAVLQPLRAYDTAYVVQPVGRRSGFYEGIRGNIIGGLGADIVATQWAAADAYRPKYQARSEIYLKTKWLSRFPSGNFGLNAALVYDYRSDVNFPVSGGVRTTAPSNDFSGLLEIRILRAVLTYQIRNLAGELHQYVPDFYMPRVINLYGVRWEFVD